MKIKTVGILGAGKVGIVLAQLALKARYNVLIAGSGDPAKVALSVKVLAPGATPLSKEDVARGSDLVILALPLGKYMSIPRKALAGTLVIDAMNYWWEVDGERTSILPDALSSSEAVATYLDESRVVKALSHMSYHELFDEAKPPGAQGRKAIAIAGDDTMDVKLVEAFVDSIGFDPIFIGPLRRGIKLEPGHSGFGSNVDREGLRGLLAD